MTTSGNHLVPAHPGRRAAGIIAIGALATLLALIGTFFVGIAGVVWTDVGVGTTYHWNDPGNQDSLAFALPFVLGWIALLVWAVARAVRTGGERRGAFLVLAWLIPIVSVGTMVLVTPLLLAAP